ncbi:MAG: FMN-binding protein [Actinomycetes bacterium]
MAGLARRLAPAAALGGLAIVIVGVADPALAGRTTATATGGAAVAAAGASTQSATQASGSSSTASDSGSASDSASAVATCANGTPVSGDTAQTRWGPVQVEGTVVDGKLCEAHAVTWPTGDGRSVQINEYAIPQLDAQAAQGSQLVDGVSGATYTSQGYYDSLQSILDKL